MIRLAIVRQTYNPHGGAERFVSRVLAALTADGNVEVTLLARRWQEDGGWAVRRIDPFYFTRTGRDRGFARAAAECFGEFDLVQSHERIPGAGLYRAGDGVHASWLQQVARVQAPDERVMRRLSRYHRYVLAAEAALFRHPALRCVVCNSRMVASDIAQRFGVAAEKLALVYNGIDTRAFSPELARHRDAWRRAHEIPAEAPLLLYVGSGFLRKGVATALRAIVPHPELRLVLAGEDKHAQSYRRMADSLGIAERVRFLGGVTDVPALYGAADAFILPTLYDPFPNACLEALAAGLPIFTSPMCGAAEWVLPGENGWVIDALDVPGYRTALAQWLAQRAQWPAMRIAARRSAEPFTLERMANELTAIYRRLLPSS